MGLLSKSKDRMLESVSMPLLNSSLFRPYGRVTGLRIDSTAKTVQLELELNGEADLLQVRVGKYELVREGDGICAVLTEIQTSKAWLTALAEQQLQGRRLKLPSRLVGVLRRLL